MDWDLWIGPAPYRPFHPAYHPENRRPWWDFGSGTVGDMACHSFHMYFNELKMHAPSCVYACGSTRHEGFMKKLLTPECQSGAIALRSGLLLEWDSRNRKVTNHDEANRWVDSPYRNGFAV
jgi:predicted dehydrogenase